MFRMNQTGVAVVACLLSGLAAGPARGMIGLPGHRPPSPGPTSGRVSVALPEVTAVDSLPDPGRVAVPSPPPSPDGGPGPPRFHRGLDAGTCAGLAAANSEEAAVIDARRAAIMAELPRHGDDPSRQMLIKGLGHEADEARNQDACKALVLFHRLAQAQLQGEVLRRSRAEVAGSLKAAKDQLDRGLFSGQSLYDVLRLRQSDLVGKQVELAGSAERANLALRGLIGVDPSEGDWVVRPVVDWEDLGAAPDAPESVALALAHAPQLLMLRTVVAEVDRSTQSAVEQLLAAVSPLAGSPGRAGPSPGLAAVMQALKHPKERRASAENLRARARQTLAWRERSTEADVRSAVLNVETGLREVAVARDAHAFRAEELDRLLKTSDRGLTPGLEVATARLETLKAQGRWVDLVAEVAVRRVEVDRLTARYALPCVPPSPPITR